MPQPAQSSGDGSATWQRPSRAAIPDHPWPSSSPVGTGLSVAPRTELRTFAAIPDDKAVEAERRSTALAYGLTTGLIAVLLPAALITLLLLWKPGTRATRAVKAALWPAALCSYAAAPPLNALIWWLVTGTYAKRPSTSFFEWFSVTILASVLIGFPLAVVRWSTIPADHPAGAKEVGVRQPGRLGRLLRSPKSRSWMYWSLMWVLSSLATCFIFDPFDEIWGNDDPVRSLGLAVLPPIIFALGVAFRPLAISRDGEQAQRD